MTVVHTVYCSHIKLIALNCGLFDATEILDRFTVKAEFYFFIHLVDYEQVFLFPLY